MTTAAPAVRPPRSPGAADAELARDAAASLNAGSGAIDGSALRALRRAASLTQVAAAAAIGVTSAAWSQYELGKTQPSRATRELIRGLLLPAADAEPTPTRARCKVCGNTVLHVDQVVLEVVEIVPAGVCCGCSGRGGDCARCGGTGVYSVGAPIAAGEIIIALHSSGGVRRIELADRRTGEALHREHSCR